MTDVLNRLEDDMGWTAQETIQKLHEWWQEVNPEEFAAKYFQPGSGYNLTLLKNQLGPDNVNWTTFEKSFKASLLRDPSNIKSTIKQWQTKDPDGLKTLLDDTEIEDLIMKEVHESLNEIAKSGLPDNTTENLDTINTDL